MDFRSAILPHRDRLFRLALSITADVTEAEDVVQDAMLKAWERRDEWPQIGNMQAWLTQITKNIALDSARRKQRVANTISLSAHTPQPSTLNPPLGPKGRFPQKEPSTLTPSPHDSAELNDAVALLHDLITQLPPPQDDILRLRDIEGYSYRDIAAQLSLTEDQVRVYLHRARLRLREQYMAIQGFGL